MKIFKRTLSLVLSVCLLASIFAIASVSAFAEDSATDTTTVDTPAEDTAVVDATGDNAEQVDVPEDTTAVDTPDGSDVDAPKETEPADTPAEDTAVVDATGDNAEQVDVPEDTTAVDTPDGSDVDAPKETEPADTPATPSTGKRPVITDVVNKEFTEVDPELEDGQLYPTYRYYFYMPDSWKTKFNDRYDGENLDTCRPGVYWWDGSFKPENHKGGNENAWPGYTILDQDPDDPHIFYCDVPQGVSKIIFNNTVDGGTDETAEIYNYAAQTMNISTSYETGEDDPYALYENGLENANNMIFISNPADTEVNDYSGVTQYKGDWFYYYGKGEYGLTPEPGDNILKNGDFPSALNISDTGLTLLLNGDSEAVITCNMPVADVKVDSENAEVVSVGAVEANDDANYPSKVTVTGLKEGDAFVVFTYTDPENGKLAFRKCAVTVAYQEARISASDLELEVGASESVGRVMNAESVTYVSDNPAIASVDAAGKVTAVAAGTANITITAVAGPKTTTKTVAVTVKAAATAPAATAPATVAPSTQTPSTQTPAAATKKANTIKVKAKKVTVKAGKSVKASKAFTVKKAVGKVTYKKTKGDKKITVKSNGTIVVKKGLKKGTYTIKVKVTAKGNGTTNAGSKVVTLKIKVK